MFGPAVVASAQHRSANANESWVMAHDGAIQLMPAGLERLQRAHEAGRDLEFLRAAERVRQRGAEERNPAAIEILKDIERSAKTSADPLTSITIEKFNSVQEVDCIVPDIDIVALQTDPSYTINI